MSELFNDKLLTPEYYHSRMSLFMRNSYGMIDRCNTYVGILKNLYETGSNLLNRFNVFLNEDYFTINNVDENSTEDEMLDVIASIFCINRKIKIKYVDADGILNDKVVDKEYTEEIVLTNRDLLAYIQVIIIKNNFQGTNEELQYLYNGTKTHYLVQNLGLIYTWCNSTMGSTQPLECLIYFKNVNDYLTTRPNIVKMFYAGLLTIESLGITYNKSCITNIFAGQFDNQFLPEGKTGWVNGYYHNGGFYNDSTYVDLIDPDETKYYYDLLTKNYYIYNGTDYVTPAKPTPNVIFDPNINLGTQINYAIFI